MEQTETTLSGLRLPDMAVYPATKGTIRRRHERTFKDGLKLSIRTETGYHVSNRLKRLIRNTAFHRKSTVEEPACDVAYDIEPALMMIHVTGSTRLCKGKAILITSAVGTGKSTLCTTLGMQAFRQGLSVVYMNRQKLSVKLKIARLTEMKPKKTFKHYSPNMKATSREGSILLNLLTN